MPDAANARNPRAADGAPEMLPHLQRLADFVAIARYEDLPAAVVERAGWVLRDTVGVIIAGLDEPENQRLAEHAAIQRAAPGPGGATLFGHGGRVQPEWAALVHGVCGTTLELDEGHAYAAGHAAIHAVPTALALGEARGASGRDTLTALILGYEVAARVGVACRLRPAVHPFGSWGVLGAAAVAARFAGLKGPDVAGVLELAASYALSASFASALQGANVRNTFAGLVNRLGLLAADFYALGFRGERGALATSFGAILGERFEPNALDHELGERFEIERGYFKPYSSCRYTHAAVEATLELRPQLLEALDLVEAPILVEAIEAIEALDAIEAITVETYDAAARLTEPAPATPLAARFSLPYVVAACLQLGHADREAFASARLADPKLLALAARVSVREDPELTARTPAQRPCRVTLTLRDGRRYQQQVLGSKGDPDQPMSEAELAAKFQRLAAPRLGSHAEALWAQLGDLSAQPNLADLGRYLTPAPDARAQGAPG